MQLLILQVVAFLFCGYANSYANLKQQFIIFVVQPFNAMGIRANEPSDIPKWMLKRLPEVKVIRKGDEVTVVVPADIHWSLVGLLIDEALIREELHPKQLGM